MSAEDLRRAAALMRERAGGATEAWSAKRWASHHALAPYARGVHTPDLDRHCVVTDDEHGSILLSSGWDVTQVVDHAASWHPAVALAVADLLEEEAENLLPATIADQISLGATPEDAVAMAEILHYPALNVARTYLGEVSR